MNVTMMNGLYKCVANLNNDGVERLHSGDIDNALSLFQCATVHAKNLLILASTKQNKHRNGTEGNYYTSASFAPSTMITINADVSYDKQKEYSTSGSCGSICNNNKSLRTTGKNSTRKDVDDNESNNPCNAACNARNSNEKISLCIPMDGVEFTAASSSTNTQVLCTPDKPLQGLSNEDYFIHDRPLVFHDDFIDYLTNIDIVIDTDEIYRMMIVITLNFALSCHLHAKEYGFTQSYHAAIDLYYLVWTISQNISRQQNTSCNFTFNDKSWTKNNEQFQQNDMWHTTIECITINNLVHVHDELSQFGESRICMQCLSELVFWNTRQALYMELDCDNEFLFDGISTAIDISGIDNDSRGKYNNDVDQVELTAHMNTSALSLHIPEEWEQFMLNIIYFRSYETARAA